MDDTTGGSDAPVVKSSGKARRGDRHYDDALSVAGRWATDPETNEAALEAIVDMLRGEFLVEDLPGDWSLWVTQDTAVLSRGLRSRFAMSVRWIVQGPAEGRHRAICCWEICVGGERQVFKTAYSVLNTLPDVISMIWLEFHRDQVMSYGGWATRLGRPIWSWHKLTWQPKRTPDNENAARHFGLALDPKIRPLMDVPE